MESPGGVGWRLMGRMSATGSTGTPPKYPVPSKPPVFAHRNPAKRPGGSAHLRDRSASYQRLRAFLMAGEPLCRYCLANRYVTPATVLDHIIALAIGGTDTPDNLAPACRDCNAAKARDEQRFIARRSDLSIAAFDPMLATWIRASEAMLSDRQRT